MPENEATQEEKVVKAWMRDLLEKSGASKASLARELKVEPRTISNAFADGASLPRGLTFYRLLRELGGLSPEAPGPADTLSGRLSGLEEEVAELTALVREALELLRESRGQADGGAQSHG